jgi:hypothetical protein
MTVIHPLILGSFPIKKAPEDFSPGVSGCYLLFLIDYAATAS